MQQIIWNKIRSNSLFLKVVSIVIISVVCVSALTMSIAIRASEEVYISTFSKSSSQVIGQVRNNMLEFNDEAIGVMNVINNSWAFRHYLTTSDHTSTLASYSIYSMIKQLDSALTPDYSDKMNILVLGLNGTSYVGSNALLTTPVEEILSSDITQKALASPKSMTYQYCAKGFTSLTQDDSVIIASKVLMNPGTNSPYGVAYIMIKQQSFQSFYRNFSSSANNILLLDDKGNVVSADTKQLINTKFLTVQNAVKRIEAEHLPFLNADLGARKVTIIEQYVSYMNYSIVGIIDREAVLSEISNSNSIVLMGSTIALLVIVIVFFVIRKTTKPISNLVRQVPQVIQGDFSTHIPVEGSYETRKLSIAFNHMLDGLNSYVDQLMNVQGEKRKAEIHALQMQINPHFIYNTLTSVKWLIWQGETEKSCRTIEAFISLLRNTISNQDAVISAAEEMANLKNYVYLQQIRYGDKIKAHFFLEEGSERSLMPKLILQPFLENSFFHAFQETASGSIYIYIGRHGDNLVSEIIDNGVGISQAQIDVLLSHDSKGMGHFTGIGIGNVNDRLKLLYGEKYGVSISSEPSKGTIMTITIPVQEEKTALEENP
jgi:Predicted signal transduction protein with a C-terminal ATPase domain